jgi:hypothetical protein
MSSANKSDVFLGCFITINTKQGVVFYLQNFFIGQGYTFDGQTYQYLPITYTPASKSIYLSGTTSEISIKYDISIMDIMVANNYFKDAYINVLLVDTDFPSVGYIISEDNQIVKTYSKSDGDEKGNIKLICGKNINALNGIFPNVYFSSGVSSNSIVGNIPKIPLITSVPLS